MAPLLSFDSFLLPHSAFSIFTIPLFFPLQFPSSLVLYSHKHTHIPFNNLERERRERYLAASAICPRLSFSLHLSVFQLFLDPPHTLNSFTALASLHSFSLLALPLPLSFSVSWEWQKPRKISSSEGGLSGTLSFSIEVSVFAVWVQFILFLPS